MPAHRTSEGSTQMTPIYSSVQESAHIQAPVSSTIRAAAAVAFVKAAAAAPAGDAPAVLTGVLA